MNISSKTVEKAERLVSEGRVHRAHNARRVWFVAGDTEHMTYRVDTDGRTFSRCTCLHGQHHEVASCSHVLAVLMVRGSSRTVAA